MTTLHDGVRWLLSWRLSVETSVGAVIFSRLGSEPLFLLLKYPQGHWDFVKGHKEASESDEETLKRELVEETGIGECNIIEGFREVIAYSYTARGKERESRQKSGNGLFVSKKVIYYVAQVATHAIELSDEHIDFTWLPYGDAMKHIKFANSKNVLEKAQSHILSLL